MSGLKQGRINEPINIGHIDEVLCQGYFPNHMAIYSALRWRRKSTSTTSLSPRVTANEDALLGWTPGQIILYDYTAENEHLPPEKPVKCIQWNIERGYRLDDIVATLLSHEADIICLQELDVHCARSNYRNAAQEIAKALSMTCVFIVEFEELFSRKRSLRTQGGGWHGNAILTKFPIKSYHAVHHSHHPVDWNKEGERMGEPRRGERVTLCVVLDVHGHQVAVYTAHLEVFCGILGRVRQFRDVLTDSMLLIDGQNVYNQLIFGDLNTMGHGVARFHPRFCRDSLRWRTMGSSEAAWWHRNLFSFTTDHGAENDRLARFRLGDLGSLRNPHFYDPVPPLHTTLRSVKGFFQGRLDWTLVRGMRALDYGLDNLDYRKSDHKLMWVELEFVGDAAGDPGPLVYQEQLTVQVIRSDFRRRSFWLLIFLVAVLAFTFGSSLKH